MMILRSSMKPCIILNNSQNLAFTIHCLFIAVHCHIQGELSGSSSKNSLSGSTTTTTTRSRSAARPVTAQRATVGQGVSAAPGSTRPGTTGMSTLCGESMAICDSVCVFDYVSSGVFVSACVCLSIWV